MATSKDTKVKDIDITKSGPMTFRDLQQANQQSFTTLSPEFKLFSESVGAATAPTSLYDARAHGEQMITSSLGRSKTPWGASMFDEATATEEQFQNLGDIRAENQPWYAKVSAGLAKGVILAGTTFLDGTLGLLFGAGTAIKEGRWSGLWDNNFSKAMQAVNEGFEDVLPNYYTRAEQEQPWYENIFTANFLGDKFIKNLGFTVGAFYSGGVTAAGLKATKLPQLIGTIAKSSKAPAIVTTAVGAVTSAVNEGRIEALNNSKDWFELHKFQLDDSFRERINAIQMEYESTKGKELVTSSIEGQELIDPAYVKYQEALAREQEAYNLALGKLSEDRLKMGNADLLMNIPILTASNIIQFGKLYANGFRTARRATNIVGRAGEYTAGTTKLGSTMAITRSALAEGTEEISQKAASVISGNYYATDVNNFYKALTDPNAAQETLSWTKSFAQGINETVNDGSSWEEFFIGTLTGALGVPTFRSTKSSSGGFQSPIAFEGGAVNQWRDYNEQLARENEIANYMNSRVNSPEFRNYYQGLIRHNKYQNDMNIAAEQGDEFEFKNAEHAQLVSDIAMFDNAGRMEDLTTLIDAAFDTSDENLASIVENTTTTLEDGSKVGPFVDRNGNPMYATPEGKQEMIEKLKENHDEITSTIKNYLKIKDEIDTRTGQQLSDSQLEELTWMRSQLNNWSNRAESMASDIRSAIGNVIGNLDEFLRINQQIRDFEGQSNTGITPLYNTTDKNVRDAENAINTLNTIRGKKSSALVSILATNPKFTEGLINEINGLDESIISEEDKQDVINKLNDLMKLGNASNIYSSKLKEYLDNPQKQAEDHARADEQAVQQEIKRKSDDLRTSLTSAQDLQSFRTIVNDNIADIENVNTVLDELESEGNEMAKNYRETTQYMNEVRRVINGLDAEPQAKQDALKLLQDQFNNSENIQQLANPNSIYINNENAFDEASEGDVEMSANRFLEAQYTIQKAMSQVNNDNKFKDRFSAEYKKPVEKREGPTRGDSRETTGDSGTAIVPPVIISESLPTTETPIGNITKEMVAEENKSTNSRTESPKVVSGTTAQYYRPAIPELHIEASKEGDFRPFDIVANEREGADFSEIYSYLRDSGAFRYVNEGNLNVGSELGFMIDPEFESKVEGQPWHTKPTIFIVDKKNNQVVGSLDEGGSVNNFEGLAGLEKKIREEYEKVEIKEKFYASPTTKVSKIMVGKIPYGTEERSLANIPNVSSETRKPVFGIIKNGVLTTNNKIADNLIIKPVDMSQKEGRLYLLIPNGAGKYSPAAVRVKHFNKSEFNLDDVNVYSTVIGEDIKNAITKLSNATSQDDVSSAMQDLAQDLYMQDVMVTWFSSRAGDGIVISKKVRRPDGTYEKVIIEGKEQIKEDKHSIYFSTSNKSAEIGGISFDVTALEELGDTSALGVPKDPNDIYNEILEQLTKFNLPLQVSTKRINDGSYNNRLISSGILTSNITDATVKGTWFTTDYFDSEGNLQSAISPASIAPRPTRKIETPVGGTDGAIAGTRIVSAFSNKPYYVDLKTNTIRDEQGHAVEITASNSILLDLAWAQDNFGDATTSSLMVDNKVLTPEGRVLDRGRQIYLEGNEAQEVKDIIAGRKKEREDRVAKSTEVIGRIYDNQKKVDKTRTDGDFYYILEDDGQYHEYSRVHSRLGSNWVESTKQTEALAQVGVTLSRYMDNPTQFSNYLKSLENKYKINLSEYYEKTDVRSRTTIVNIVRDAMSGTNSQRALNAGSAVDSIIRQYFTIKDISKIERPSNMSESAFIDLITNLNKIKSNMELMGERFLADNIVLYHKYPDGTRIAGEVDILSVDKDGNFRIYDVKTSRYSFYEFTDRQGHKVNYFTSPSATQRMSSKDYYTLQLSAYKNLFESQYSAPITKLAIMPFVLGYEKEKVTTVQIEKGIPITYNPAVNVPLVGATNTAIATTPIFETSLETQNPIDRVLPENSLGNDSIVGYYEKDGKLYKGYVKKAGEINGISIYITKERDRGFGREGEMSESSSYFVVLPNGKFVDTKTLSRSDEEAFTVIMKALSAKPQKVKDLANEKTILFNPIEAPVISVTTAVETPATINQSDNQSGAAHAVQREQAINNHDEEFEDEFTLRKVDTIETTVWNQEKELAWLNKILPQLSENDRIQVVKGLIKVGKQGTLAWGQFDNGIVTLSDVAAEGTTYHEAFHVVFNLLLDNNERQSLYNEAKKLYGEKDNLSLEEDMAEGFREYVMTRQNRSLGRKILDFFKELFVKVTNWNNLKPSLTSYYRMINEGKYSSSDFKVSTIRETKGNISNTTSFSNLSNTVQENLLKKGWTAEKFDSVSQRERDQAVKCMAY